MSDSNIAYDAFVEELEAFANALPADVKRAFSRDRDEFRLTVKPPTSSHRELTISGSAKGIEYQLGKVWSEPMDATPVLFAEILAACDALGSGAVRECRDLRTGLVYHLYRFRTRGLNRYARDGEYSFWHWPIWRWIGVRVRKVSIHRLPPLGATG